MPVEMMQFRFVPTGSLAVEFKGTGIESIESFIITAISDDEDTYSFTDLEILPGSFDNTYAIALLGPLPFGKSYDITATIDSQEFSETLTLPAPTFSRTGIIRQRLFELLLPLENDDIEVYGAIHQPLSIGNDFKPDAGITIEIGVASLSSSQILSSDEIENMINIPLNFYAAAGNPDSAARVTEAAEYVWGYLQSIDWHLSYMAIQRERAVYQSQDPDLDADRKLVSLKGSINLPMPVIITI